MKSFRYVISQRLLRIAAGVVALLSMYSSASLAEDSVRLRTGDVLSIELPGEAALSKDVQVDRRGQVILPEIGGVEIAKMTLPQATERIRSRLSRAFRDLGKLSVTLKERKLLLTVHGYVKPPGNIELPPDATVQMAIVAAGGLVQGAQLDRVVVTSAGGKKQTFDYKKFLDTGDMSLIPVLQPLDVIFVPASPLTGNVQIDFDGRTLAAAGDGGEERTSVKVFGEVNQAGTFAWKAGISVVDMLMRAGGVTRFASPDQIRIISRNKPQIFNLQAYLDSGDRALLPDVEAGSTIFVPKQVEEVRRGALTVYVMGEVARPGAFETRDGASFIDILANSGGPTRFADTRQIRIIRGNGAIEMVDLPRFTDGKSTGLPPVRPGDAIFVPEKTDTGEPSWLKIPSSRAVQVLGALSKPGRFEWSDEMSLFDLLSQAGGPTARADIRSIRILRNENDRASPTRFDLEAFLKSGGSLSSVPKIRAGFVIMVPELPQDPSDNKAQWTRQAPENSIYVMGQVGVPGRYAFNSGLGFLDIITAANGPTATADLRNIRVSHRGRKGSNISHVNLSLYFQTGDEKLLPRVRPGDVIFVPDRSRDYLDLPASRTVRVIGAIGKPGRYQFNDTMTILDLLAEAGGPTNDALQDRIIVVNMSVGQSQARSFNLVGFAKTGDIRRLPVVRAGDLVYVPNKNQDEWKQFMDSIKDVVSAAALVTVANTLRMR